MALKLTLYDIIKGPVLTDKTYKQYKNLNTLALNVHPEANKVQIAQAIERLFNVKVKKVRTSIRKGKIRTLRAKRTTTQDPRRKRAFITLAEGYSLDLLGQGVVQEGGSAQAATPQENK
jgi:large subunit ribosomal protein L23